MYKLLTNTDTNIILLCLLFFRSLFCFPKHRPTSVPRSQRNPLSRFTWFTICGIAQSRISWWPFVVWWRLSTCCKIHHVVFILQGMTQTWAPSLRWIDWWACMYWENIVDRKEGLTLHSVFSWSSSQQTEKGIGTHFTKILLCQIVVCFKLLLLNIPSNPLWSIIYNSDDSRLKWSCFKTHVLGWHRHLWREKSQIF